MSAIWSWTYSAWKRALNPTETRRFENLSSEKSRVEQKKHNDKTATFIYSM